MNDIANVFVFSVKNRFLHTVRGLDLTSPDQLKADVGVVEVDDGIEIIGTDGGLMAARYTVGWTLVSLHRTDFRLSRTMVRKRLRAWTDSLLERVDDANYQQTYESVKDDLNPFIPTAEVFRETVVDGIPRFGRRPLEECFDMVDNRLFPTGHGDIGSPWHMLTHL